MGIPSRASTGSEGIDRAIDGLRLGDNVVWQVDSVAAYRDIAIRFARRALQDGRRVIYLRFGLHQELLTGLPGVITRFVDPGKGFESFASQVHALAGEEGRYVFYVFDCLSDLLQYWHSDLMTGNFFRVTCPYLYELDTVAYFAIQRDTHAFSAIATIRETTQLLLDLYSLGGHTYLHPLKVWQRYSPTMFFPHLLRGEEALCITASSEVAELFSRIPSSSDRPDSWHAAFAAAREAGDMEEAEREAFRLRLMPMLTGSDSKVYSLCHRYLALEDLLQIASREIGTGLIGGKSIGMLLARKILEKDGGGQFIPFLEMHDSFYLGSDIFYSYIVENGCWRLRLEQKTREGYFERAQELKEKLMSGRFPKDIREQFVRLLGHFGQSPVIVRSSSLLEDDFGNAFSGKYESVFCVNQGTAEERYEAFEQAVRTVYASTMNEDALAYRLNRGLMERDEQMAILVQRVSGDRYGEYYFPHIAGVGNSSNLYVWDSGIDMSLGMLRLVFGLGTRAVDRTEGDYVRIVSLDDPLREPPVLTGDRMKYSQHKADTLSLTDNGPVSVDFRSLLARDVKADRALFASPDTETARRLRELGYPVGEMPMILDFKGLLAGTRFPALMRDMLALLSRVYDYPVDIEFTANFTREGAFRINLLQCRPLQTRGLGAPVMMPEPCVTGGAFFCSRGSFMGGNVRLPVDRVVYVDLCAYRDLPEQDKHAVARAVGQLNAKLKGANYLLMGPGRWGTTTPALGVPVRFSEICHAAVLCEVSSRDAEFMPELSYGSHFFQDIVETGIFYAALFQGREGVSLNAERIMKEKNLLASLLPQAARLSGALYVADTEGMEIFSDIGTQTLVCR